MIARVVVTGGRNFTDARRIDTDLRLLADCGLRQVAEGFCPLGGADHLAHEAWLRIRGESTMRYPMRRDLDGTDKGAYLQRNIRMIEAERPDLGLAYPDPESKGTWHCVREMLRRGIPVAVWTGALPDHTQTVAQIRHHRDKVVDTVCCSTRVGHTIFMPNGRPPNCREAQQWPPIILLHKLVELFDSREAA